MAITAALVKELRDMTGAGMMDCKKALAATDGDMDKAVEFLREKGLAGAAKKAGRVAAEGVVTSYIHAGGKIGVLVEVNCETDFVANTDEFKEFARENLEELWDEYKRDLNPQPYPVDLSQELWNHKMRLISQVRTTVSMTRLDDE